MCLRTVRSFMVQIPSAFGNSFIAVEAFFLHETRYDSLKVIVYTTACAILVLGKKDLRWLIEHNLFLTAS
jgi:hypothetical protein